MLPRFSPRRHFLWLVLVSSVVLLVLLNVQLKPRWGGGGLAGALGGGAGLGGGGGLGVPRVAHSAADSAPASSTPPTLFIWPPDGPVRKSRCLGQAGAVPAPPGEAALVHDQRPAPAAARAEGHHHRTSHRPPLAGGGDRRGPRAEPAHVRAARGGRGTAAGGRAAQEEAQEDPAVQRLGVLGRAERGAGRVQARAVPRGHVHADGAAGRGRHGRRHPLQGLLQAPRSAAAGEADLDPVLPGVPVPHAAHQVQRRVQLDGHLPAGQRPGGALRALGLLRPPPQAAAAQRDAKLRRQQDEKGCVVRVELRRPQRPPAVRHGAVQVHPGGHLRRVRPAQVPASRGGQVLRAARPALQVLPRLRELQLQGLHHREVLRQRTGAQHHPHRDGRAARGLRALLADALLHPRGRLRVAQGAGRVPAPAGPGRRAVQRLLPVEGHGPVHQHALLLPAVRAAARRYPPQVVPRRERVVARAGRVHGGVLAQAGQAQVQHTGRARLGSISPAEGHFRHGQGGRKSRCGEEAYLHPFSKGIPSNIVSGRYLVWLDTEHFIKIATVPKLILINPRR